MGVEAMVGNSLTRPSCQACVWDQRRIGSRCVLATLGALFPAYFALFVLPMVPLYFGHIKSPAILLSNIMAARATYQSLYITGFGIPMLNSVFLLGDISRHLAQHGVSRQPLYAFQMLVTGACGSGLLVLLAFNFEDSEGSLESKMHYHLHNLGTLSYFIGAGLSGWIYSRFVIPEAEALGAMNDTDASWVNLIGWQISRGTCLAGSIRALHLAWPLSWAYPMLIIECYVIGLGVSMLVFGNWRLLMHLDATEPLLDLAFLSSRPKQG